VRKGRFRKPAAELAQRYGESVSFDWRLSRHDIAGFIAHAAALVRSGIITANERQQIEEELPMIEKEIESGSFKWDRSLEDVHMNIEAALTKRIGAAGVPPARRESRSRHGRGNSFDGRIQELPLRRAATTLHGLWKTAGKLCRVSDISPTRISKS
jgi:argininosuccinate lyase